MNETAEQLTSPPPLLSEITLLREPIAALHSVYGFQHAPPPPPPPLCVHIVYGHRHHNTHAHMHTVLLLLQAAPETRQY